jgi:hypothetical protein
MNGIQIMRNTGLSFDSRVLADQSEGYLRCRMQLLYQRRRIETGQGIADNDTMELLSLICDVDASRKVQDF